MGEKVGPLAIIVLNERGLTGKASIHYVSRETCNGCAVVGRKKFRGGACQVWFPDEIDEQGWQDVLAETKCKPEVRVRRD